LFKNTLTFVKALFKQSSKIKPCFLFLPSLRQKKKEGNIKVISYSKTYYIRLYKGDIKKPLEMGLSEEAMGSPGLPINVPLFAVFACKLLILKENLWVVPAFFKL
jgi:hypothetical protein